MLKEKRVAFIGGGFMGEALLKGLHESALIDPEKTMIADIAGQRLAHLKATYGVRTTSKNEEAITEADVAILAVKPQDIVTVLRGVASSVSDHHLFISIAAGVPMSLIESALEKKIRLIRVMPNTPASVLSGAAALAPNEKALPEDLDIAREIFNAVGKAVTVPEYLLDAVTGLSGSGPAYVFVIIEALADGGVKMGLPRDVALTLAAQTVLGSARMFFETGEHPGRLKDMVASPGGTTIAGLHALEQGGLRGILMNAVEAATERSKELGRLLMPPKKE